MIINEVGKVKNGDSKQVVFTVTRTYTAPDGTKRTKTTEYYGSKAEKLINELKERERLEKLKGDDETMKNIEKDFDAINNPDQWLENGFKTTNVELPIHIIVNDPQQKQQLKQQLKYLNENELNKQLTGCNNNNNNNNKTGVVGCINTKQSSPKFLFIKEALDEHNRLRNLHRVPYLKLNRDLCNIAQEWAEKIANTGKFEHSNNKYENQSLGENIAMRYSSTGEELNGKQMTDQWYEEASNYNYNLDFQPGKGHFAQIVWKQTREVGFGRAQSKDGKWYAVANYYPAGNYIGQFCENVLEPRK